MKVSSYSLPDFQAIRERPALHKVLDGIELNEADIMALELRAAEIERSVTGLEDAYDDAVEKAVNAGFMPKEVSGGYYTCNDDDLAYMAAEAAAETLHRHRQLNGLFRRRQDLLCWAGAAALSREFAVIDAKLQFFAGNLLDADGGWEDYACPDMIVAEYIERFYSTAREDDDAARKILGELGKKFRRGLEQAAHKTRDDLPVAVFYKRVAESGQEGVFRVEVYPDSRSALGDIHDAFDEAWGASSLSSVEVAFADGEFLPAMSSRAAEDDTSATEGARDARLAAK